MARPNLSIRLPCSMFSASNTLEPVEMERATALVSMVVTITTIFDSLVKAEPMTMPSMTNVASKTVFTK